MRLEVFNVVKLNSGDKATILEVLKNQYKAEIVSEQGERKEIRNITDEEIKYIIV